MGLDIVKLHQVIDQWAAEQRANETDHAITTETAEIKNLPEGKRAVRTKTQGDRVYLLDEVKKTRQWVTTPEILAGLGFGMDDVTEVSDDDFMKYQMASALYKLDVA